MEENASEEQANDLDDAPPPEESLVDPALAGGSEGGDQSTGQADDPFAHLGSLQPIDHQLQRLISQDHPTIMKLGLAIPPDKEYPYEEFLKNNFSPELRPFLKPYSFNPDHFDRKSGMLMDVGKPHTYLALFRFMEFFRSSLAYIERVLPKLEDKFRFFKLLAKQKMDQDQIDRKKIHQNIHNTFMLSYNMLSHSAHVQSLFKNTARQINQEVGDFGGCNLRKFYSIRHMEKELHPDYHVLLNKVPELLRILTHIDRLQRALDSKQFFR